MTRTDPSPKSRPGRVSQDEPPTRLEQYRAERATLDLAFGDFHLSQANGKTVLTAIAPTPADTQVVRQRGFLTKWDREDWETFLKKAEKFKRSDLLEELEELKDAVVRGRVSRETPVFDDDSKEKPIAVHTLLVHYSKDERYVRIRGTGTHEYRKELQSLGLRWSPSIYEWESSFSEDLLEAAARFVERNDRVYNPDEIGYERCANCGRWNPKESAGCPCRS